MPSEGQQGGACQNRALTAHGIAFSAMDIERINQIGSQLDDLTARTGALRGYL
jgi:hypothetical protein